MKKKHNKLNSLHKKSIEKYFEDIAGFTPLRPDEEIKLTRKARQGESSALHKLVKANLRFVISIAKRYQGNGLALEDLICEGNLGLIKAANKFDETRGFKFISYAVWWIKQSILQALAEQTRIVRLPMNHVSIINKVNKAVEKNHSEHGEKSSIGEIADCLEMTESEVSDIINKIPRHLSLNAPFEKESENSLLHIIENTQDAPPDDSLLQESLKEEINRILDTLKTREAEIVKLYFGLVGERSLTLEEIGDNFQMSRERVRQIKNDALRRLRHKKRLNPLRKYLC